MGGGVTEVHQGRLPGVWSTVGQDRRGLGRWAAAPPSCPSSSRAETELHVRLRVSSLHFVFSFLQHRRLQWIISVVLIRNSVWSGGEEEGEGRKYKACTAEDKGRHRQGGSSRNISVIKIYH